MSGLIARTTVLKEDASLATFYIMSLALGVLIISIRGDNVDLIHILFGTVLALNDGALLLLCGVTSITILALSLLFRLILMESVDSQFLSSVSLWGAAAHYAFLALVVLNLVAGSQDTKIRTFPFTVLTCTKFFTRLSLTGLGQLRSNSDTGVSVSKMERRV